MGITPLVAKWLKQSAATIPTPEDCGPAGGRKSGGGWFVEGDTNGDGTADLIIQITVTGGLLVQTDFLP